MLMAPCSVDLGSGVGNALVNVATQTSAATYGTEIMPNPARLGTLQIAEAKRRWHMWALRGTEQVRAYEADFCKHEKTGKALRAADLVVRLCPMLLSWRSLMTSGSS